MNRYRIMPSYRFYDIEGTSPLTLDKSAGKPLRDYKIYGNSIQEGTPSSDNPVEVQSFGDKSKNLFNEKLLLINTGVEKTEEGYVVSLYPAIYHTAAGYDSDRALVDHIKSVLKPGITYTFSRKVINYTGATGSGAAGSISLRTGTTDSTSIVSIPSGNGVKSVTFSLTQEQIDSIATIYVYGRTDTPTIFEYIQLEESETATDYEPYGYKITNEVSGKNLFDISKVSNTSKIINNGDGSLTVSAYPTATAQTLGELCPSLKVGDIVTINAETTAFNSKQNVYLSQIYFLAVKLTWKFGTCLTITQDILNDYPRFYCGRDNEAALLSANISNIQIEYGTTATAYASYKEPVVTNIYLDEPLRRVSDCADYINYINNKVVRNIFEYVFTGEERWATPTGKLTNTIRSYTIDRVVSEGVRTNYPLLGKSEKGIFDGSSTASGDKARCQYTSVGAFYARINLSDCADPENPTAQDFKNIYTKGTKIYGVMAEPVEEEVSLPIIKTHKGTNIITVDTSITPYNMDVQYYK